MPNLIDTSFFVGEINIPNTGKLEIQESLTHFITKYEQDLLQQLFGYELWKSYNADNTTPRFAYIINGVEYDNGTKNWRGLIYANGTTKLSLIANYIYYQWMKDKEIWNSGIGVVRPTPNQAIVMSPGLKMVEAWNDMSEQICEFYDYMNFSKNDVYPEWSTFGLWQFKRTNDFDI
jgi:hypothetical protein